MMQIPVTPALQSVRRPSGPLVPMSLYSRATATLAALNQRGETMIAESTLLAKLIKGFIYASVYEFPL